MLFPLHALPASWALSAPGNHSLCHPLPLGKITVDFERGTDFVRIEASVKTRGVTGVEMEALTAASSAALTVFDMIKAVNRHAVITDIRVLEERRQVRRLGPSARTLKLRRHTAPPIPPPPDRYKKRKPMSSEDYTMPRNLTGLVIVASTRAARGVRG